MIILDTNVVSELMRPRPELRVVNWLDRQPRASVWTTAITILEARFGLQTMPEGKRRVAYTQGFEQLLARIDHRVALLDTDAAEQAAILMAARKMQGRPRDLRDTMIAGIVLSHRATLATRNISHFDDVPAPVTDPWRA